MNSVAKTEPATDVRERLSRPGPETLRRAVFAAAIPDGAMLI